MAYIGSKPADKVLTASDITDGVVSNAKLAQDIISADTELAVAPASTDELLISDAGVLKRIDYSLIGGTNTPAFEAKLASDVSLTDDTSTKLDVGDEIYDTDGCYDSSTNFRFLPTTAGKYFVYGAVYYQPSASNTMNSFSTQLKKNGSTLKVTYLSSSSSPMGAGDIPQCAIVDMNGTTDYLELYAFAAFSTGTMLAKGRIDTFFGAFKLIT